MSAHLCHWDIVIYMKRSFFLASTLRLNRSHQTKNILIYYDPLARNLHHKFTSINITLIIVWLSPFSGVRLRAKNRGTGRINFSANPNNLIPVNRERFPPNSRLVVAKSLSFFLLLLISSNYVLIDFAIKADSARPSNRLGRARNAGVEGRDGKFIKKYLMGL